MNLDEVQSELPPCTSRTPLGLVFLLFMDPTCLNDLNVTSFKLFLKVSWHFILVVCVWQCVVKVRFLIFMYFLFPLGVLGQML